MPTLGAPELIIILVIIILIFGVGKLPEVGQALGKGIREFRGAADSEDEPVAPPAKPVAPAAPVVQAPVAVEAPRPAPVVVEAPRPTPVAVSTTSAASVTYIAVDGDTPEKVASSHGVSVDALLAANGWSRRDRALDEGDKVQIPIK